MSAHGLLMVRIAQNVIGFWAGVALGLTLCTLAGLYRLVRRPPPPPPQPWPDIVLLRPCRGADPRLEDNLASSARAPYPGRRRVLLLSPGPEDPSWAAATAAARDSPPAPALEVVATGDAAEAANHKVAQLARGIADSDEEIIVSADSDVLLGEDSLTALVGALVADPGAGCAFASPVEVAPRTLADRASAALVGATQQNFLALYALSTLTGGAPSLSGALCAYRRRALADIGGMSAFADVLGEDDAISRRLRAAGWGVRTSPSPARCTDSGRGLGEVVGRVGRWLQVVRAQRPALLLGYPTVLAVTAPLLAACLWVGGIAAPFGVALAASRWVLAMWLGRLHGRGARPLRSLFEVVAGEGLMWLGLARTLSSRRITWRGGRYRVGAGGRLSRDSSQRGTAGG